MKAEFLVTIINYEIIGSKTYKVEREIENTPNIGDTIKIGNDRMLHVSRVQHVEHIIDENCHEAKIQLDMIQKIGTDDPAEILEKAGFTEVL